MDSDEFSIGYVQSHLHSYSAPADETFSKSYEKLTSTHRAAREMVRCILNREFILSVDGPSESSITV